MDDLEVDNQGEDDGRMGSKLHVHGDTPVGDHDRLEHWPQFHVQMNSVAWFGYADNTVGQPAPHGVHAAQHDAPRHLGNGFHVALLS